MRLTRSHRKLSVIIAFAVIFVSLGSLINFHQHKIWGKQLIPQLVASTRAKDESKYIVNLAKTVHIDHDQYKLSFDAGIFQVAQTETLLVLRQEVRRVESFLSFTLDYVDSSGLRAPPAA